MQVDISLLRLPVCIFDMAGGLIHQNKASHEILVRNSKCDGIMDIWFQSQGVNLGLYELLRIIVEHTEGRWASPLRHPWLCCPRVSMPTSISCPIATWAVG